MHKNNENHGVHEAFRSSDNIVYNILRPIVRKKFCEETSCREERGEKGEKDREKLQVQIYRKLYEHKDKREIPYKEDTIL